MKALLVLSAVIAVVLSAPPVDKRYVRPGQYVPLQSNRYYNSYNPGRNVYSSPRWYQSTTRPLKYEASTLSPWQGKAKFSFGSAVASTPAAAVQPEAEQKAIIVESAPAVPKVPAGFGAFHFGKKSTPIVVTKEEIKPIETITPEIKITKTIVESSSGAEASPKPISSESSSVLEEVKPAVIETVSVQSLPEVKLSTGSLLKDSEQSQFTISSEIKSEESLKKIDVQESSAKLNKTSYVILTSIITEKPLIEAQPILVDEPKPLPIVETQSISEVKSEVITPVVTKKKHGFSFSYNPSSNVYNINTIQSNPPAQQSVATVSENKPQSIVIQAIQPTEELKATVAPASLATETLQSTTETIAFTNEYVVPTLDISQPIIQYQQSVPSEEYAVNLNVPSEENKPATLEDVPSTIEYAVPTLDISQPIIQYKQSVPSEAYAVNLNVPSEENKPATLEDVPSTIEYAVPTLDISQPIIQYQQSVPSEVYAVNLNVPSEENKPATLEDVPSTIEYAVPTLDISQPIIQYGYSVPSEVSEENKPATLEDVPSTSEYVVPTADISQPIIQYASSFEENAQTTVEPTQATTESSPVTSEYASGYSPINSESIVETIDTLLYNLGAPIKEAQVTNEYLSTESDASTTENTLVTTESVINLQNDFEPALTTGQAQLANVESVAIESSAPLVPEPLTVAIQSDSVISSESSYSTTPAIVKKKLGFSFSFSPSGYAFNKDASLAYKPNSEVAAPVIKITPAVTTLTPSTVQYLQPEVSSVIPAANVWSNSYNAKKNSYSFSYNPSFSYFNKQPFYQPQVAVPSPSPVAILTVPSTTSIVSSPVAIQSSPSYVEISPLTIESSPAAPEPAESTAALLENLSEDAQTTTTESSLSETTTLSIEYGTVESEEKLPIVLELASTAAKSDLATQSPIVESSKYVAVESLSSKDNAAAAPSIAPQVLPVANVWSNTNNIKKNSYSFSSLPSFSFFNKPAYQLQIAPIAPILPIATESASLEPELSESTTAFNEIATDDAELKLSSTESHSDESTTLVIESSESFSTTQTAPTSVESVAAVIESSIKEALKGQLIITPVSIEAAPVLIESASAIKTENITQSSSVIKSPSVALESASISVAAAPVSIQSTPAAAASVQAIAVPLYVKQESKVSPPAAFPAFQPSFVTKKHGFSFSYKPSGNYYSKPVVIASAAPAVVESSSVIASAAPAIVESSPVISSAAPAIVESSPVISSTAPAIVESSPVISSAAPAIVESSPVISSAAPTIVESSSVIASVAPTESSTSQSIFLSLFNAVKSAILDEEVTEASASAKPEIALSPSVVAEPQQLNTEAVASQYDIAVKASPIISEIKEEADIIHDLRLGY